MYYTVFICFLYISIPGVIGHEFLGIVEEVEDGCRIAKGQKVVGEINLACGRCDICARGGIQKRNHCPKRTVLGIQNKDGTFADYITLPVENLFPVPSELSDERAVFAEPLAAAFRIIEQGLVTENSKVAVIGDGKLGLLIAEAVGTQNMKGLTVFGRHVEKLKLLQNNIETVVVDGKTEVPEDQYDVTIEATGSPEGLKMAITMTRPLGVVVMKSTYAMGSEFNTFQIVVKELQIIGSRCGNFQMALDAMKRNNICPENLITKVYPFEMATEAIKHAGQKGTLKIQLVFD